MIRINEKPYMCLHEAGHVFATYLAGGYVELVEMMNNPGGKAHARVSAHFDRSARKLIACGGFAVEYLLYRAGRIVDSEGITITEKSFINASIANARLDKLSFFDGDFAEADGSWPADMDNEFMTYAIKNLVPAIGRDLERVELLASALDMKARLGRDEIEVIINPGGQEDGRESILAC